MKRWKLRLLPIGSWRLVLLLVTGCVGDLPPLSPEIPVSPKVETRQNSEPQTTGGVPGLPPPPLGVPPSLSPFTRTPPPEPLPPPAFPAPAPGQFGGPSNNGPVTGYGPGGMQPVPGAPPNPPYTYRTAP